MAVCLQAQMRGNMSRTQAGFTLTELMVVVVIIGVLAATALPSMNRDSTARKGRDFANMLAQNLQRARYDALATRLSQRAHICQNEVSFYQLPDTAKPTRKLLSAPNVNVWDVKTTTDLPTRTLSSITCADIDFTPMGSTAGLNAWSVYVHNDNLVNASSHPDGGFRITVNALTGFVSLHPFSF